MRFFKLNEDDILRILIKYLSEENGFGTYQAKAIFLQDDKELRAMVGITDDENIISHKLLLKMDSCMEFNHEDHRDSGLTDEELLNALEEMIETGDF